MLSRLTLHRHYIGGILLIAGTSIGAAVLALPISTGMMGFIPTMTLFVAYWLFMLFTALCFLEVNLSMKGNVNFISMARHTLGRWGEIFNWIVYLYLLYALTTAYIAGSGPIFHKLIFMTTGYDIPTFMQSLPLILIFGYFVYRGAETVDYANRFLMLGLVITYMAIIIWIAPYIEIERLHGHVEWRYFNVSLSVIAVSFGYHIIIPTLSRYLDHQPDMLKKVILFGSIIPLVCYIIWETVALGVIPITGENGLAVGYQKGLNSADLLAKTIENPSLLALTSAFSFFTIVTSFLGVSLSLRDFLADGFKIKENHRGKILLYILTFLPPMIICQINPRAFLTALEHAGAFGVVLLLGLMPALMVWFNRYRRGHESPYRAPGGKPALILTMVISIFIITVEIWNQLS